MHKKAVRLYFYYCSKFIVVRLDFLVFILDEDEDQSADTHQQRVEAVGDDGEGVKPCEACRSQKLCTVGDKSLAHGAEHIQQGGAAARRYAELFTDILSNRACHNNRNGVVRSADINEQRESSNTKLATLSAADAALDEVQHEINTAVFLNQSDDAGYDDRNNGDVIHRHNAVANVGEHFGSSKHACSEAYQHTEHSTDNKNHENVDTAYGTD